MKFNHRFRLSRGLAAVCTAALLSQGLAAGWSVSAEETAYEPFEILPTPSITEELTDQREPSVKYFRRSDGSTTAAFYDTPVHYEQDGVLLDIDNTLLTTTNADGESVYTNAANSLSVSLPTAMGTRSPVTVESNGYTVSWIMDGQAAALSRRSAGGRLTGAAKQPMTEAEQTAAREAELATITDPDARTKRQNEHRTERHKLNTAVTYNNALGVGIGVRYDVQGSQLKESILLKHLPLQSSFSYTLQTGTLTAELNADGSVNMIVPETGKIELRIAAPVMWDAENHTSDEIAVTLTATGEPGEYRYTLTPDRGWLSADDRAWPVTIDPTVVRPAEHYVFYDTFVSSSGLTSLETLSYDHFCAGESPISGTDYIGYIKPLYFSGISQSYLLTEATLTLEVLASMTEGASSPGLPALHIGAATSDIEQGFTWATQPGHTVIATNVQPSANSIGAVDRYVFDVTQTVADWIMGRSTNYGFKIYHTDGVGKGAALCSSQRETEYPILSMSYFKPTEDLPNDVYYIQGVNAKVMDVDGSLATNGARVRTQGFTGNNEQRWKTVRTSDGTYTFQNMTDQTMYLSQFNHYDGDLIGLMVTTSYEWNKWYLYDTANGYLIRPACSMTRVLDVYGMQDDSGYVWNTDIHSFQYLGGVNQFWQFKKAGTEIFGVSDTVFVKKGETASLIAREEDEMISDFSWSFNSGENVIACFNTVLSDYFPMDASSENGESVFIKGVDYGTTTMTIRLKATEVTKTITVICRDYETPVAITYDQSFLDKMGTEEAGIAYIDQITSKAYEQFLEQQGLYLTTQSVRKVTSLIDECQNRDPETGGCTCTDVCSGTGGHHTNKGQVLSNSQKFNVSGCLNLHLVGQNLCEPGETHNPDAVNGTTWLNQAYVLVRAKTPSYFDALTIFHEFGHCFGVEDHYTLGDDDPNPACVWGVGRRVWENYYKLCPVCEAALTSNINRYDVLTD